MTLQEQYEAETGKTPWDTIEGFSVYTDDYVEWLCRMVRRENKF